MIKPIPPRALLALCVIFTALLAQARNEWFDKPVGFAPGITIVDSIAGAVDRAVVHVRMAVPDCDEPSWGIVWNYTGTGSYRLARLTVPALNRHDDLYRQRAYVEVSTVRDGVVSSSEATELAHDFSLDDFNSLKLVYEEGVCRVLGGHKMQQELVRVPFGPEPAGIGVYTADPAVCRRLQVSWLPIDTAAYSACTSVDGLMALVAASDDRLEGIWEYMDRNIDLQKAELGGRYRVAVVRSCDGYDIVYLSGADIEAADWAPLRIKGRLSPTIFTGNYDMVWYDSAGRAVDEDVNAQLSDDGAILTLRFPLLDAQIRLRRMPLRHDPQD